MPKKSLKKRKLSKALKEWMALFIQEEIRQGTAKKEAEKVAVEVIHTLPIDTEKH
jgi:hypothetical protein